MPTEAMVPMAGLAAEWAVNANTVSRRLKHLGIKPERQGNLRFITAEQKAQGDQLQDHITKGGTLDSFPMPEGSRAIQRRKPAPVAGQVVDLMAVMAQLQPRTNRAEYLAKAAQGDWIMTTTDLVEQGVRGVRGWKDGHQAYGYRFHRHNPSGREVLWTVSRALMVLPSSDQQAA